jgi:hypothetical protein
MDGFDLLILGFMLAAISADLSLRWNIGRAVGGLGPLAIGALASRYSFHAAIGLLASIYVVDILATVLLIPELKGKELE